MPRPTPLPLHDGGDLYHPEKPLGFHPALRAAAHLLVAGERAASGLARSLREEVLPHHPPTERFLRSPRLRLAPDGTPHLYYTARPAPRRSGDAALRPEGPPPAVRWTLDYLEELRAWTAARHLTSPYVREVLLLTLGAWYQHERLTALAAADRKVLRAAGAAAGAIPEPPPLPAPPWGPWVAVLTGDPAEADIGPLLDLAPGTVHLRLARGPASELAASRLTLHLPPWRPDLEPWDWRERHLLAELRSALARHREATLARYKATGHERHPAGPPPHHFDWMAHRHLHGRRPTQLARRHGVTPPAVHQALNRLSELLDLPLRAVKPGPEPW